MYSHHTKLILCFHVFLFNRREIAYIAITSQANIVAIETYLSNILPYFLLVLKLLLQIFLYSLNKLLRTNVRIYSEGKNMPNEYSKYIWMVKIVRIFLNINIFVTSYLNIFEYPNILYTLVWIGLDRLG